MDVEKFINLLYERKCLWDQSDSNYHLRDCQRNSWKEVAEEMNTPVEDLKKKWRGLRDTFGRELKKSTKTKSDQSADAELVSKWSHFKKLLFLKDKMSRRDPYPRERNMPNIYEYSDSEGTHETNISEVYDSPVSPAPSSSYASPTPQSTEQTPMTKFKSPKRKTFKRQRSDRINEKLLQIEEEKFKCFQKTANDPDVQFLMSLLPFLKDLPKGRKLIVRAKLQQVLIDEQN